MADEITDVSNKEQVAICLRSIDEGLEACEDFIGLHYVDSIKADTLVAVLKDATMSQARLNHLLLLHTHKDRTDGLQLASCLQVR